MVEMCAPRRAESSCDRIRTTSLPWKSTLPSVILPGGGMRRMMDVAVMDLPQPLSPTMPTTSPLRTKNEAWSTGLTTEPL